MVYFELRLSNRIHSLKYQMSTTLGCKDIGIKNLEFVSYTNIKIIRNSEFVYNTVVVKINGIFYQSESETPGEMRQSGEAHGKYL